MLRTMILISITDFFKKKQTNENETRDSTREVCNNEIESIGYHRLINTQHRHGTRRRYCVNDHSAR